MYAKQKGGSKEYIIGIFCIEVEKEPLVEHTGFCGQVNACSENVYLMGRLAIHKRATLEGKVSQPTDLLKYFLLSTCGTSYNLHLVLVGF